MERRTTKRPPSKNTSKKSLFNRNRRSKAPARTREPILQTPQKAPTEPPLFEKIVKSADGARLDLWLRTENPTWSRKQIKQLLDDHRVAVNGKTVYVASWALKTDDRVSVFKERRDREHFVKTLFEDQFLIVVDKPPFMTFNTLVDQINLYLKRKGGPNFHPYLGTMHRLDRDTSGVFIATVDARANHLSEQFRDHTLRKVYWAVVEGRVPFSEKQISLALKKGEFKGGRRVEVESVKNEDGKHSVTNLHVLERYKNATLLEVTPQTGRTHQIRAHLSAIGFPILGDQVYGGKEGSAKKAHDEKAPKTINKSGISFRRQALHAHTLQFTHPMTGKKLKITAPLPKDMQDLIDRLRG